MSAANLPSTQHTSPQEAHLPLPLLRQYAAGMLSADEQYRVEAHTMVCSRCADVLAGLMVSDTATTDHAVAGLRQRLQARVGEQEHATQPVWRWQPMAAAAALLVLLSTAFWFGWQQRQPATTAAPAIARIRPIAPQAALPARASASAEQAVADARPILPRRLQKVKQPRQALRSTVPIAANRDEVAVAASSMQSSGAAAAVLGAARPSEPVVAEAPALAQAATQPALPADSVVAAMRLVRGRIVDAQGQPLPGATVQAAGAAARTATVADGTFALRVPAPVTQINVSSVGFLPRQQPLNRDTATQLTLALTPDSQQLNEVVKVRREKAPAPVAVNALPTGGYPAFRQYLKDSLDYPTKALEERKEGTVQLGFTVAADGSVQDVKVLRHVSEEIDAEATRLLLEGPKWFPAIRNGRRIAHPVRVSVPFKLEDHL